MPEVQESQPRPPVLVVLSGPSGVGKDAALAELKLLNRPWHFVVTATTRPKRPAERDGVDYIFLETAEFLAMKDRDEFLECAEVYGRWYGVPRSQVRLGLQEGKDVILKIDVQGADTVRRLAPQAVFIFLLPGSWHELQDRLALRMTESSPEMELRLDIARSEVARVDEFEYRVVNREGGLAQAVSDIDAIISAEKSRVKPRDLGLI
ncbi:MAG: guanylate kinase [SAR202 cluster bacterium Io17-Chloro-G9]|nr:MAG: guanylate kinase [SAR202 cluster bacterium Io17-Chloro-G9]